MALKVDVLGVWKNKLYLGTFSVILAVVVLSFIAPIALGQTVDQGTTIPNPLGKTSDFPSLLRNISRAIIVIVLPIAVIGIIFAGFKFVTASAQGNTEGIAKAKKMLYGIIIGTVLVVAASALASAVVNFAKNL